MMEYLHPMHQYRMQLRRDREKDRESRSRVSVIDSALCSTIPEPTPQEIEKRNQMIKKEVLAAKVTFDYISNLGSRVDDQMFNLLKKTRDVLEQSGFRYAQIQPCLEKLTQLQLRPQTLRDKIYAEFMSEVLMYRHAENPVTAMARTLETRPRDFRKIEEISAKISSASHEQVSKYIQQEGTNIHNQTKSHTQRKPTLEEIDGDSEYDQ